MISVGHWRFSKAEQRTRYVGSLESWNNNSGGHWGFWAMVIRYCGCFAAVDRYSGGVRGFLSLGRTNAGGRRLIGGVRLYWLFDFIVSDSLKSLANFYVAH